MRIVGGEFRGRALQTPGNRTIRPTTDRIRESLFNILSHAYGEKLDQTRVLDLFAGTGALGLEALSRGAKFALFIENSIEGRSLLRQNVEKLSLQGRTKIYRRDATRLGEIESMAPFDLVFADPPYGKGFGKLAVSSAQAGNWLADDAFVVLEEDNSCAPKDLPGFDLLEQRTWSTTTIGIFRRNLATSPLITKK